MSLFYFGEKTSETTRKLLGEIENIMSNQDIEIFHTIAGLLDRLRQLEANPELFVFFPSIDRELLELVAQKELFNGHPIVLVLPNRRESTINIGHLLMPRFLTFNDSDPAEVRDVLKRMCSRHNDIEIVKT